MDRNDVAGQAVQLVRQWVSEAGSDDASAKLLGALVADPQGLAFAMAFVDRVVRPEDHKVAARALAQLTRRPPRFLPPHLRLLARAGVAAPLAPRLAVGTARRLLRALVSHLVIDARARPLGKAIAQLRRRGDRLNINLLGEAVLGDKEATARLAHIEKLVRRPDVDYVSVKVSAVVAQLSMWAFDEMVGEVTAKLRPIFRLAARHGTFINLDMEEYRDLDLTLAVFRALLADPELKQYSAGIVLQTYLPDALGALESLTEWALARVQDGGAPIKVRIVKGANLAMERTDAALHGWTPAPFDAKVDTDTNYKRVLEAALTPARTAAVHVGVAGHNLFDVAFAHLLAQERRIDPAHMSFEMLLGMATAYAEQVRTTVGPLLLYTPVVAPAQFEFAIAYLVRRLDENAASANFMSAIFSLRDPDTFARERNRFLAAVAGLDGPAPQVRRRQARPAERTARRVIVPSHFTNAPDTDPALAVNREWGRALLAAAATSTLGVKGAKAARLTSARQVDKVIARARSAASGWARRPARERAAILQAVADVMTARRGELLEVMASEAGKVIEQGDPEVSEAIDFARYYAERATETVRGATFTPAACTLVAPPWNFPVAIPAGSALAALATGSPVLLKPAGPARRCGALLAEMMWKAGVPRDVLQLIDVDEQALGHTLITHPGIDRVILTGSFDTAALFRSWRPDLPLLAETSGKNSLIVTPAADLDLAAQDAVRSAFGHAGQKCSAASLLILVGSLARSRRFTRQLLDAAATLRVGYPWDPRSSMGPLIAPPADKLRAGLTRLGPGERWLAQPRQLDASGKLWSPGIRTGVRPGSQFHQVEYFGPVLGIMHARTLAEAITWQNEVDYGLTAGLHSLDPGELQMWLERVQAGNLYVNRVITGAIVRRQPFGGWKKSAVGAAGKAGGPNYLLGLGTWSKAATAEDGEGALSGPVRELARAAAGLITGAVRAAFADDAAWFAAEYAQVRDVTGLDIEMNVLRYLPTPVVVRLASGAEPADLIRQLGAGLAARAPLSVSLAADSPAPVRQVLAQVGLEVQVESSADFNARMVAQRPARIRLLAEASEHQELARALAGDPAVAIHAGPSTYSGRLEPLFYLREQAISITSHRFGEVDPWARAVVPTTSSPAVG